MQDKPSGDISPEDQARLDEVVRALRDSAGGRIPASWVRYLSDALKAPHKPPPKKRGRKPCGERHVAIAKDFAVEAMWGFVRSRQDPKPVRSLKKRLAKKHAISLSRCRAARFNYQKSPEVQAAITEEIEKTAASPEFKAAFIEEK